MMLPTAYWPDRQWMEAYWAGATIDVDELYPRKGARNRCWIEDLQGRRILLTVPVLHARGKQLTRDVEICYQKNWQHRHWNALISAYNRTPYFFYFADMIKPLYQKQERFLVDLNYKTIEIASLYYKNVEE